MPTNLLLLRSTNEKDAVVQRRVYELLSPLIDKYGLEAYGFRLFLIPFSVITKEGTQFKHHWAFADLLSPEWPLVQSVFFTEHDRDINEKTVGQALGYPIIEDGLGGNMISYLNLTEAAPLGERRLSATCYSISDAEFERLELVKAQFDL
jgi:hypothetical protein